MIVPAHEMPRTEDIVDPSDIPVPDPVLHDKNNTLPLREGESIITKDSPDSTGWYVAEIFKVLPTKIIVKYFSTPTPQMENHKGASPEVIRSGSNKLTSTAPGSSGPALMLEKERLTHHSPTTQTSGSGQAHSLTRNWAPRY